MRPLFLLLLLIWAGCAETSPGMGTGFFEDRPYDNFDDPDAGMDEDASETDAGAADAVETDTFDPDAVGSCEATCDGCCEEGVCLAGRTSTACGVGGEVCGACRRGLACGDGICEAEGGHKWILYLDGATINPLTGFGATHDTDSDGTDPDPVAEVNGICGRHITRERRDTLVPEWENNVVGHRTSIDRVLGAEVELTLEDHDSGGHEHVGSTTFVVDSSHLNTDSFTIEAPREFGTDQAGVQFHLRFERD